MPKPPEASPIGQPMLERHLSPENIAGHTVTNPNILELLLGQGEVKKRHAEVKHKAKDRAQAAKRDPEAIKRELEAKQARAKGLPEGTELTKELLQARNMIEKIHGASAYMDPNHIKALPDAALLAVNLAQLPNELRTPEVLFAMWTDFASDIPLASLTAQARQEYYDMQRVVRKAMVDAARYNPGSAIAPDVVDKVMPEEFSINAADLVRLANQPPEVFERSLRTDRSSALTPEKDRFWIYDATDREGVEREVADKPETLDDGRTITRNKQPLRDVLKQLESMPYLDDERSLNQAYEMLANALGPHSEVTRTDLEPYASKIREQMLLLRGQRWAPNAAEMKELKTDWKARDRMFFDRIDNVLRNPFQQAREVMNLYDEVGVDAFIKAVEKLCGPKVAAHYEHLKQSIFLNHDLDIIARHASGDVELFKKLTHIAHTSYMRTATTDPLAVAMMSSYEQALREILHDNNGFLPPSLFGFNEVGGAASTQHIYWDELAMKIFKSKVSAGIIRDFKRYNDGIGVARHDNIGYELADNPFTQQDLEEQFKRIQATQHMAKGVSIFNHRILEIFASAKAAGLETSSWKFGSIPYEGIARFFRPHGHLFGKYGMGELSHDPVFKTLFGGEEIPVSLNFMRWSPDDWREVKDAMAHGTLEAWVAKKYPGKIGKKVAERIKPFLNIMEEFSWTGRFGPHSGWGENDATVYFTDKQREYEGGSMRLAKAEWWADRYLEHTETNWKDKKNTPDGREKLRKLKLAYSAWVWAQLTLRSPETVAQNVYITDTGLASADKKAPSLRKVLIKKILGIDIDTQVATERTPDQTQEQYAQRVGILQADIAVIQQAALYGGHGKTPREIIDADYDLIKDDPKNPLIDFGTGQPITAEQRIREARQYIEGVKRAVLGDNIKTIGDWQRVLGISFVTNDFSGKNSENMLHIANWEQIESILRGVGGGEDTVLGKLGKLGEKLINRPQDIYMGMDDVRWEELDVANLGERAFARLTNDLEYRKVAVEKMMALLGEFKQHMDQKKVLQLMEEMYRAELAGRGPDSARAFVYYFARLFGEYYRGHGLTKIPYLGQLLRRTLPWKMSVAQMVHGKDRGDVWSINNVKQFLDLVAQIGALPEKEIAENGALNKYSMERLEKELVAGRGWAILEMIIIGYAIAAAIALAGGATKSVEEESKN
ncbi:hypothetical protein HY409_01780 [Candidatus Gottesmanbacteria bacterium]|nr:hypothetical protein [Candidatus Gottesmanbacteria bacterium]